MESIEDEKNENKNQSSLVQTTQHGDESDTGERMEEVDEESREEEANKILHLYSRAERQNQKRLELQERQQQINESQSWRNLHLSDHDDDSDDTDDEDDPDETKKFLSMIRGQPKKQNLVNIRWVNGKVEVTPVTDEDVSTSDHLHQSSSRSSLPDSVTITKVNGGYRPQPRVRHVVPDTVTITRVPAPSGAPFLPGLEAAGAVTAANPPQPLDCVKMQKEEIERRRAEARASKEQQARDNAKGKRKFEDRMTLTEAKMTDFQDSRDYVDFLQSKLQGINIKIVK